MQFSMKNTFSIVRRLSASVFSKHAPSQEAERPAPAFSRKPVALPPAEAAETIEFFLLETQRLSAALSASTALRAHDVSLAEWAFLKEIGAASSTLLTAARRLRLSRHGLRRQIGRLEKKDLVQITMIEGEHRTQRKIEVSPKGREVLEAFSAEIASVGVAGSGVGYRRAGKLANLLQRSLRKSPLVDA
jgi:DNA-binding MarR family transcriptional regulator